MTSLPAVGTCARVNIIDSSSRRRRCWRVYGPTRGRGVSARRRIGEKLIGFLLSCRGGENVGVCRVAVAVYLDLQK